MSIKQTFDNAARDYDLARKQLIPCFDDFYDSALEIVTFPLTNSIKILDLGAGTGLFSSCFAQRFHNARFTLYDISDKMLKEAKKRFSHIDIKVDYMLKDYSKEPIEDTFDLIISALSIHHLTDIEKERLFQKLFFNLNSNGLFINADQVLGETPFIDKIYRNLWLKQIKKNGVTGTTLSSALERMKEDKMSTLSSQLNWLKKANFSEVNCWYQNYSFAVYSGWKK